MFGAPLFCTGISAKFIGLISSLVQTIISLASIFFVDFKEGTRDLLGHA
jgi:hypothetical protein